VRTALSTLTRRLAILAAGLAGAAVLASSCTLDAVVATDRSGLVTRIDAVRIQSGALDLALALAIQGGELVLEFRWGHGPAESASAI
jgi:hypothetical protein